MSLALPGARAAGRTPQWADFVRAALVKNPDARPNASQLLQHPW
jgi:hypothetical protein